MSDMDELQRSIVEGDEYLVVGIIFPAKQRYAEWERAASARQAEDLARVSVQQNVVNGVKPELWVAGVVELDDGKVRIADRYACFVDPDEPPIT